MSQFGNSAQTIECPGMLTGEIKSQITVDSTLNFARLVVCLVTCLMLTGCVRPSTRRIDAQNMAKAEDFRREFDQHVPAGSSRATVDRYLASHQLKIDTWLEESGTGEVFVEMFREEWPMWFCGKGSVGLYVEFSGNRLVKTKAGGWSNDCP